jgi:hypothetical protein
MSHFSSEPCHYRFPMESLFALFAGYCWVAMSDIMRAPMPYQIAPSWHIPYDIIIALPALSYAQPHPGVFANITLFPSW